MGLKSLQVGKWSGGRCASRTPQPSPLGKASYVATTQSRLRPFFSTSDQFFSSCRWGPNQMPSILHEPSLQMKGLGRAQPFYEPNRKLTDFSRLMLAPVITSYLLISLLTSSTLVLLVTSMLTLSVYVVYLATSMEPGNMKLCRARFAFNLRKKGSSGRMYSIGDSG